MSATQHDKYDHRSEVTSDGLDLIGRDNRNHRKKVDLILQASSAERGDHVLEVGCGHGLHAETYDRRFKYVGVDLSSSLVAETERRLGDGATVLQRDATDLPMPDSYFDAVVGTAILHHIDDQRQALAEWARVTRDGGTVTLMEPNYRFPKATLSTWLDPAERNKRTMTPARLETLCGGLDAALTITPHIYTPPWPAPLSGLYDAVDDALQRVPAVRWLSQMLMLQLRC